MSTVQVQRLPWGELLRPLVDDVLLTCNPRLSNPAEVHQLRIALVRLRVALTGLVDLVDVRHRASLAKACGRIHRRLGELRDLDVLRRRLAAPDSAKAGLAQNSIERQRKSALRRVRAALKGSKGESLRAGLYATRHRLLRAGSSTLTVARRRRMRVAAAEVLARRYRHMVAAARIASPGDSHKLRIQVKKLRYTIEMFAPIFGRSVTAPVVLQLERIQDQFGEVQDALVHRRLLEQLTGAAPPQPEPKHIDRTTRELRCIQRFWTRRSPGALPALERSRVRPPSAAAGDAADAPDRRPRRAGDLRQLAAP